MSDAKDAARYRWLNKQHNMLIYIEDEKQERQNVRLRCGQPLDEWIDNRIEAERPEFNEFGMAHTPRPE